jgi:hypothetical protein
MLGRKKNAYVGRDLRGTLVVGPSAQPSPYGVFRFGGFMEFHPVYGNWGTSYNVGKQELFVASQFFPGGDKFQLIDLPMEEWVQLSDRDGRPIPLEIYVDHTGVQGRWLP